MRACTQTSACLSFSNAGWLFVGILHRSGLPLWIVAHLGQMWQRTLVAMVLEMYDTKVMLDLVWKLQTRWKSTEAVDGYASACAHSPLLHMLSWKGRLSVIGVNTKFWREGLLEWKIIRGG